MYMAVLDTSLQVATEVMNNDTDSDHATLRLVRVAY